MKLKFFLSGLVFFMALSMSYASFPVVRVAKTNLSIEQTSQVSVQEEKAEFSTPAAANQGKNKWVGVALWFFLGWPFAAHRWYYGKPVGWNILFILTFAGIGIWAIVDLINMLTDNF